MPPDGKRNTRPAACAATAANFAGKRVLITGAAGGIGHALVQRFAQAGATLALVDSSPALTELAAELGAPHRAWRVDLSDEAAITRFAADALRELGPIDILINNAGIAPLAPAATLSTEIWDSTMSVNLRAPFLLCRAFAGPMLERGWGRIVNLASQAALIGIDGHAAYSASKAGLLGMSYCMALEWGPRGVTVNCISPTVVDTPMGSGSTWSGERGVQARREIPVGRFARPEEIAAAAAYLASEDAAMINGSNLVIDGGRTIR
ncbi:short-chain dehydrogenase [Cephaloticoccus primus]|uniref:Short-chain dehydrogenase n=1 Tax=Cephaloticoccus primus TaxID=1548207 RepID=A0A139STA0_9BACT|nr:short-chain dehydrogenase [Cephaloticoccus primus]